MRKKRQAFFRKLTSGQIDWAGIFGRYVWDRDTTPYFTAVDKLTLRQVTSEVRIYAVIVGLAALCMSLAYLSGQLPSMDHFSVSLYCFLVACAALVLGVMRFEPAAWFVASFPVVGILRLAIGGIHPNHGVADRIALIVICLLFALYTRRLIRITRHDPLPDRRRSV